MLVISAISIKGAALWSALCEVYYRPDSLYIDT